MLRASSDLVANFISLVPLAALKMAVGIGGRRACAESVPSW